MSSRRQCFTESRESPEVWWRHRDETVSSRGCIRKLELEKIIKEVAVPEILGRDLHLVLYICSVLLPQPYVRNVMLSVSHSLMYLSTTVHGSCGRWSSVV